MNGIKEKSASVKRLFQPADGFAEFFRERPFWPIIVAFAIFLFMITPFVVDWSGANTGRAPVNREDQHINPFGSQSSGLDSLGTNQQQDLSSQQPIGQADPGLQFGVQQRFSGQQPLAAQSRFNAPQQLAAPQQFGAQPQYAQPASLLQYATAQPYGSPAQLSQPYQASQASQASINTYQVQSAPAWGQGQGQYGAPAGQFMPAQQTQSTMLIQQPQAQRFRVWVNR